LSAIVNQCVFEFWRGTLRIIYDIICACFGFASLCRFVNMRGKQDNSCMRHNHTFQNIIISFLVLSVLVFATSALINAFPCTRSYIEVKRPYGTNTLQIVYLTNCVGMHTVIYRSEKAIRNKYATIYLTNCVGILYSYTITHLDLRKIQNI
jgi:hypothetical protein